MSSQRGTHASWSRADKFDDSIENALVRQSYSLVNFVHVVCATGGGARFVDCN